MNILIEDTTTDNSILSYVEYDPRVWHTCEVGPNAHGKLYMPISECKFCTNGNK